MKKFQLAAAAGLLLATMGVGSVAEARPDHRPNNGYHDNGRHNGWNRGHNRHCRTEWRHHRRGRVCR